MQWGIRIFVVVGGLLLLGVVALVLQVIVRPVVTEARRASAAGDWWLPFLPREDGSYGPLASNHWWSAMRAEQRGTPAALAVRWGFWALMAALLVFTAGAIVVNGATLLASAW